MRAKRARRIARKPKRPALTLLVEDTKWRRNPTALKLIRRAARLALDHPPRDRRAVTILLTDDAQLKDLNRQFRRKNKPTNVLSFASPDPFYWGDVAIASGVVAREARAQGKTIKAHAAHLAVHGILHLKGYDHANKTDRASMEAVETVILSRLDLPNPYAPRPYTRPAKPVN